MANKKYELATFGSGCFWCTEAVFQQLKGVEKVISGYAGGVSEHPTYTQVSSGQTGHAEVVQLTFNPLVISYAQLLEVFFLTHNPTTRNQQGADKGTQYRSIILYHSEDQKRMAEAIRAKLDKEGIFGAPIVTEIVPYTSFTEAEEYHKDYYANNPDAAYCQVVIDPKIAKMRDKFKHLLK